MKKFKLIYIPNAILIIFALLLFILAFDSFSLDLPWYGKAVGFLISLIPSAVVVGLLIISNKVPIVGSIISLILFILFTLFFKTHEDIIVFLTISVPLLLTSLLYFLVCAIGKKNT